MLALLLAGIGLFGVISYHAAQRTQEIGERCALGAQQHDVLRLILGQGLRITLIRVGIGLGVSLGLTRLMARFLAGLNPTDPLTFAGASVLWLFVRGFRLLSAGSARFSCRSHDGAALRMTVRSESWLRRRTSNPQHLPGQGEALTRGQRSNRARLRLAVKPSH